MPLYLQNLGILMFLFLLNIYCWMYGERLGFVDLKHPFDMTFIGSFYRLITKYTELIHS